MYHRILIWLLFIFLTARKNFLTAILNMLMVACNWHSKVHMGADKNYTEYPSRLQACSRMKKGSLSKIKGKTEKIDEHAKKNLMWKGKPWRVQTSENLDKSIKHQESLSPEWRELGQRLEVKWKIMALEMWIINREMI